MARYIRDEINKGVGEEGMSRILHYEEIQGGHASFLIGKNTDYLRKILILMNELNQIPYSFSRSLITKNEQLPEK